MTPVPGNLQKLSDVVDEKVVKKDVYYKLVTNVDAIDTSKLVQKINMIIKLMDIEGKISNITGLAITATLTAVKIEIPTVDGIYKKSKTVIYILPQQIKINLQKI